jgi:hypothetical protein
VIDVSVDAIKEFIATKSQWNNIPIYYDMF